LQQFIVAAQAASFRKTGYYSQPLITSKSAGPEVDVLSGFHCISAYFGVCDAVVNTFMFENLRLDRDLEIKIQRKLGGDTTTSFLALQSQFNKAV